MADKPMPRHKKMYAHSPTLETDENGKKYIKKNSPTPAEKKSAQVSDGTDGLMADQIRNNEKEKFALYQKHINEYMDMHTKHMLTMAGGANPGATGGEMIEKVEKDKGE